MKLTLNGTVSDYEYRYTSTYQPFYGWGAMSYPEGQVSKSHSRTFATNFQQLINYAHSFGDHNMTLLFGHENSTSTDEGVSATRSGMFSYFDNQELSGAIKVQDGSSNQSKYNTEGYFSVVCMIMTASILPRHPIAVMHLPTLLQVIVGVVSIPSVVLGFSPRRNGWRAARDGSIC